MLWIYQCVFLGLLCLHGVEAVYPVFPAYRNGTKLINEGGDTEIEGSGGQFPFSDDEDLVISGSGSGIGSGMGENNGDIIIDGMDDVTTTRLPRTTTTTTDIPLTKCQTQRVIIPHILCMDDGEFKPMQCSGMPGESECYCVDLEGKEIPGTHQENGYLPDCEEGTNLPPCTFQIVSYERQRKMLLGTYRPKCTYIGLYEKKQCRENFCFCVNEITGKKIMGSEVNYLDTPNCEKESPFGNEEEPTRYTPLDVDTDEIAVDPIDIDENPDVFEPKQDGGKNGDIDIGGSEDDNEDSEEEFNENDTGNNQDEVFRTKQEGLEEASEIMTQPGILAGIIGGSVVVLLCLVLLVMFVVYRMRKKDEGSYPLDEPNRRTPNYSYVRAPQKEFYA